MYYDPIERQRKIRLTLTVLAVGLIISALLAIGLVYMGRTHPHNAWIAPQAAPGLAADSIRSFANVDVASGLLVQN